MNAVPGVDALAAFHHPLAYAATLGADFGDAGSGRPRRSTPERSIV